MFARHFRGRWPDNRERSSCGKAHDRESGHRSLFVLSKVDRNRSRLFNTRVRLRSFAAVHMTLKMAPAIKAGPTERYWTLHDLARLPDLMEGGAAA